jgi:hypothetical protein
VSRRAVAPRGCGATRDWFGQSTPFEDEPTPEDWKPIKFELVDFDELRTRKTSSYLIKGVLPDTGLVIVWGPPKCGARARTWQHTCAPPTRQHEPRVESPPYSTAGSRRKRASNAVVTRRGRGECCIRASGGAAVTRRAVRTTRRRTGNPALVTAAPLIDVALLTLIDVALRGRYVAGPARIRWWRPVQQKIATHSE